MQGAFDQTEMISGSNALNANPPPHMCRWQGWMMQYRALRTLHVDTLYLVSSCARVGEVRAGGGRGYADWVRAEPSCSAGR